MQVNKNASILITGTSSGVGEATAKLFLMRGYNVIGIDHNPATIRKDTCYYHELYQHYQVDIRCKDQLPKLTGLHYLIFNAGVLYDHEDTIGTNVQGTFNCEDVYVGSNLETLKSIVILSSIAAYDGQDDRGYVVSKAGLLGYTKWLANNLEQWRIRVNSLSLGAGETPMNSKYTRDAGVYDEVARQNLLGRWNQPIECAEAIYFLAVNATFCTGVDLLADGGEIVKTRYVYGQGEGPKYVKEV